MFAIRKPTVKGLLRGAAVAVVLGLGGAAPVVAVSAWSDDGFAPYHARHGGLAYEDRYDRLGRDAVEDAPGAYPGDVRRGRGVPLPQLKFGCTARRAYFDRSLGRYTTVNRVVPCQADLGDQ